MDTQLHVTAENDLRLKLEMLDNYREALRLLEESLENDSRYQAVVDKLTALGRMRDFIETLENAVSQNLDVNYALDGYLPEGVKPTRSVVKVPGSNVIAVQNHHLVPKDIPQEWRWSGASLEDGAADLLKVYLKD